MSGFGDSREEGERSNFADLFAGSSSSRGGTDGGESEDRGPLPTVSLPTGGGALRSIAEAFEVNAATGAGSTSIALPVPPGRAGMEVSLSLGYSTGSGNGPFGAGWSLSPPSIARKTERGLPRYTDADTFVLRGADDLVPVGPAPEASEGERVDYEVERYRPRVERAYARIERWRHRDTRAVHWRVTDRNNVVSIFGRGADARVEDRGRVLTWLLEEVRDDRGNIARYEYQGEDGAGLDPVVASERHRFVDGAYTATAQRYLKRIRYGNRRPSVPDDWMFEVALDYGEHEGEPRVDPRGTWSVRPDPFSSYRGGFEVRTLRRCERVLVFHHFPGEPGFGGEPELVRQIHLDYDTARHLSKLTTATVEGVRRAADGTRERERLPPIELEYSAAVLHDEAQTLEDAPSTLASFVDLEGDGLPGALCREDGTWRYRDNLGSARLAPPRRLPTQPSGAGGAAQLLDVGGDGELDLVQLGGPTSGYWTRTREGSWRSFVALSELPNIDFSDPRLRFVDLDGDGHADLLLDEERAFVWYRAKPRRGFEEGGRVSRMLDERRGPQTLSSSGGESIQLADMTGDGLSDIVRVRPSAVCYWPNLGFGRFGAKVTMERAPTLASASGFDPSRVLLGDLDGSGTADLVYLDARGARVFLNESGNGFADEQVLRALPPPDALSTVSVVDLLGTGTGCLVWSSSLPNARTRFIDVLGSVKPHLLIAQRNGLGLETRVRYAPSTKFFLEDRAAGRPWLTRLPFPVQVVERVERYDAPRDARLVRTYRYRHGYFDPHERETRGFGYVETRDTESFSAARGKGLFDVDPHNEDARHRPPPSLTKQWFHTGAWLPRQRLERGYAAEYFDDASIPPLPDTPLPPGRRSAADEREMIRALAGTPLRTEVYAEDGSPLESVPYAVTEQSRRLRLLVGAAGERHAVVAVDPGDALAIHYERRRDDPRVLHTLTLEVDDLGQVRRAAELAYPRRTPSAEALHEQGRLYARVTETDFVHRPDELEWYRVGVSYDERAWELRGLPTDAGLLARDLIDAAFSRARVVERFGGGEERRLVARAQQLYLADDRSAPLPLGAIESRALPLERHELAWTLDEVGELLADVPAPERERVLRDDGGYVLRDGGVWRPSGRVGYDASGFFLPVRLTDPFGATSRVEYDRHALFARASVDALGNRAEVTHDYRALAPRELLDPNLNRTAVRYDALGRVVAVAALSAGDTLERPTVRVSYDLHARPAVVRTDRREVHADPASRWQRAITFSDGAGETLLEKRFAELGPAHVVRDGEVVFDEAIGPRWIASGRVVLDAKGNPVKRYEPYFVRGADYEPETALLEVGVTPLLRYDPLSRLVETELPDGTRTQVELSAWSRTEHDANDLSLDGPWAARMRDLANAEARPGPTLPKPSAHARAGSAKRSRSPTVVHLDPLGRDVVTVVDNRARDASGALLPAPTDPSSNRTFLATRVVLDLAGSALAIVDPRGERRRDAGVSLEEAACALQRFDRLGRRWRLDSVDAGEKRALLDATDNVVRERTANGVLLQTRHDGLRRPLDVRADGTTLRRFVYGEAHPEASARNLRGQLFRAYDGAGVLTQERFDPNGNLEARARRVPVAHVGELHQPLTYDALPGLDADGRDPLAQDAMDSSLAAQLEPALREAIEHDALSRPVVETLHDGSVLYPRYNDAGLLEAIDLELDGARRPVIANIDYDAHGRRTLVEHADRAFTTTYRYDPLTFRLTTLRTVRASDGAVLQHLAYTYDAAGDITSILDHAAHARVPGHDLAAPHRYFDYDGLGQLIEATGRAIPRYAPDAGDDPRDPGGLRRYTERYAHDPAGNLRERAFRVDLGPGLRRGFTQRFDVEAGQLPSRPTVHGNRLLATESTAHPATGADTTARIEYPSDDAGNMLSLGLGTELAWGPEQRLGVYRRTDLAATYAYDATGERARKRVEVSSAAYRQRVYFGAFERYREVRPDGSALERTSLSVSDGDSRTLLVEREGGGTPRLRFQLGDHLDTVSLEVDETGAEITYEEHLPYGETALFLGFRGVPRKRYRYTGKERDEESGLQYHSARYLVPWLGRWCSADPAEFVDGPNLFSYVGGNVVRQRDSSGLQRRPAGSRRPSLTTSYTQPMDDSDPDSPRAPPAQPTSADRARREVREHEDYGFLPASTQRAIDLAIARGQTDAAELMGAATFSPSRRGPFRVGPGGPSLAPDFMEAWRNAMVVDPGFRGRVLEHEARGTRRVTFDVGYRGSGLVRFDHAMALSGRGPWGAHSVDMGDIQVLPALPTASDPQGPTRTASVQHFVDEAILEAQRLGSVDPTTQSRSERQLRWRPLHRRASQFGDAHRSAIGQRGGHTPNATNTETRGAGGLVTVTQRMTGTADLVFVFRHGNLVRGGSGP